MFPSPEYIKLCTQPEVADRLREEREPQAGDWYISLDRSYEDRDVSGAPVHTPLIMNWSIARSLRRPGEVWLPRLDQLIEMLEERGCDNWELERDGPNYELTYPGLHEHLVVEGPDPETALLRAWLEVVEDEQPNE